VLCPTVEGKRHDGAAVVLHAGVDADPDRQHRPRRLNPARLLIFLDETAFPSSFQRAAHSAMFAFEQMTCRRPLGCWLVGSGHSKTLAKYRLERRWSTLRRQRLERNKVVVSGMRHYPDLEMPSDPLDPSSEQLYFVGLSIFVIVNAKLDRHAG
jgi:hypothetical protein